LDSIDLSSGETAAPFESYWTEPELGDFVIALNVHVLWLLSVAGIEVEPIWTHPQSRWHAL
jgi:hypothetical protein